MWIPVPDEEALTRTKFDSNGQPTTGLSTNYIEPYGSGYSGEDTEYNTMKTQVLRYGGFFIGRFEAGINSTTLRTATTTAQPVVSKRGVAPYNWVPWGKSMSDVDSDVTSSDHSNITTATKGAVYLAKNMYEHPDSVESTLCYGSQWDAMCRYIGDSNRKTPVKSAAELTGNVTTDVSKNIYDLAGNCYEWTMEAGSSNRVLRGGYYDYGGPVSLRYSLVDSSPCDVVRRLCFPLWTLYKVILTANRNKQRKVVFGT